MIKLTAQGKFIDTKEIKHLFTQGEKHSDVIHFVIDAENNDVNLRECIFVLRTVASDGSMSESKLIKTVMNEQILLMWNVSDTATAKAGMVRLELIGLKAEETIIKFKMPPIYIKDAVMGSNIPIPDTVEQKLLQMNEILEKAEELSEQISGEGGIVNEVEAARRGSLYPIDYNSLAERLEAEFNFCVRRDFFEMTLRTIMEDLNKTGVGEFWKDDDGNICGEIFNDYDNNTASGMFSSAMGSFNNANSLSQMVIGRANIADNNNKYIFIIGNGENNNIRSNALTVDWDGKLCAAGDIVSTDINGEKVSLNNLKNMITENSELSTPEIDSLF